jgi:hypothetical protein
MVAIAVIVDSGSGGIELTAPMAALLTVDATTILPLSRARLTLESEILNKL